MGTKLTLLTLDGSTAIYQLVFSLGIPQITSVVLNGQEFCNMDQKSSEFYFFLHYTTNFYVGGNFLTIFNCFRDMDGCK